MDTSKDKTQVFVIPLSIVGTVDLHRTKREIDEKDSFMRQSKIRRSGKSMTLPKMSKSLEDLASGNKLSLLNESDRKRLKNGLEKLEELNPKVHVSFPTPPSNKVMKGVVQWFRSNVNQYVLVDVGLQPNLAAGCELRTRNKIFDLSLRSKFERHKSMLSESIKAASR